MKLTGYAKVKWTIADIKTFKPDWSDEACETWLAANEDALAEIMIERGWNYIDSLIGE